MDRGQALMLILAVPAVCLLLVVLTQVETWMLHDQGPPAGGQPATGAGQTASPAHARAARRR